MSAPVASTIFVSYRTSDRPIAAKAIYCALKEAFDVNVFWAPDKIGVGQSIPDEVQQHLHSAALLILVVGPDWFKPGEGSRRAPIDLADDWVRLEIRTALDRGIPILPVYVAGGKELTPPDLPEDVRALVVDTKPDSLAGRGFKYTQIRTGDVDRDLTDLVEDLERYHGFPRRRLPADAGDQERWRPTTEWQLRHLERLEDQLRWLNPAIPPQQEGPGRWLLSEVFVPLELHHARYGPIAVGRMAWGRLIDSERIALTGEAGAGKSTILRHLVLEVVENRRRRLLAAADSDTDPRNGLDRIPIWIELPKAARRLAVAKQGLRDLGAVDWLDPVADAANLADTDEAKALLDTGDVLLVLDGLDEIADPEQRTRLTDSVRLLPRAFGGLGERNLVVVGCRGEAWQHKTPYAAFDEILLQPMDRPTWEEYLNRWCEAIWRERAPDVLENLTRSLRSDRAVQEMASNPQTATMLAVLASHGPLPTQRVRLFDEFVQRSLDSERLERFGGKQVVRQHLVALALALQQATTDAGKELDGLSKKDASLILGPRILEPAAHSLGKRRLRELGSDLLNELAIHTGLIAIDRAEVDGASGAFVRFRHRMIQEFLVATHYVDDPMPILEHVQNPAWLVAIALTAGMLAREDDEESLERYLRRLLETPGAEPESADELARWGKRVAALSACLEELSNWKLPSETLAPAIEAHETSGRRLLEFPLDLRISIGEGMGMLRDFRLTTSHASRWVEIAAGRTVLGSSSEEAWPQEQPVRETQLSEYWIQRWPVTIGEYAQFMDAGGYSNHAWWDGPGLAWLAAEGVTAPDRWELSRVYGNRPVTGISWWEAMAYGRWLTTFDEGLPGGWSISLPTEAQWERAARGPYDSPDHRGRRFPWGASWRAEHAAYALDPGRVCPVGLFPAGNSPEGIWDLAGNVSERCLDGFAEPAKTDVPDPCWTDYRFGNAVRGGDYASPALNARVSARFPEALDTRNARVGFRCAAWLIPEQYAAVIRRQDSDG